jgi:glucosyl-dolichyl phosphate glucuronosyltransferase
LGDSANGFDGNVEYVSIIVSCFSRERLSYLSSLLQSISRQESSQFEVVVVVDGPPSLQNEVASLVSRYAFHKATITSTGHTTGASASRNLGARVATGPVLGFVDDDVILDSGWVKSALLEFQRSVGVAAIVGTTWPRWDNLLDSWLPRSLFWIISCSGWFREDFHEVRTMWTMNSAVRREVFLRLGGFREELGPRHGREAGYWSLAEDLEFSIRMGSSGDKIFFSPSTMCYHNVQHSQIVMPYIARRAMWIGKTRRGLSRLHVRIDTEAQLLFSMNRGLFERDKGPTALDVRLRVKGFLAIVVTLISAGLGFAIS